MPRVAAPLDVSQVSDFMSVESAYRTHNLGDGLEAQIAARFELTRAQGSDAEPAPRPTRRR
jgi:hypothetical protein